MSIETAQDLEALRRVGRVVAETIAEARARAAAGHDDRGARRRRRGGVRASRRALGAARHLRLPRLPLPLGQRRGGPRDPRRARAARGRPRQGRRHRRARRLRRRRLRVDPGRRGRPRRPSGCGRRRGGAAARDRRGARAARRCATSARRSSALVEARGFSVLRDLQGHGVGRAIHEPPEVPSWDAPWATERLTEGLVMTIEPIIGAGGRAGRRGRRRLDDPHARRRALRARGAHDRRHARSAARAHRSLSRPRPGLHHEREAPPGDHPGGPEVARAADGPDRDEQRR